MGFFGGDAVVDPPDKSQRRVCWDARDAFFACLNSASVDNSLDPKQKPVVDAKCAPQLKAMEQSCVASWVKYFQEKRAADIKREKYIEKLEAEGAQPLPFKLSRR